MSHNEFDQRMKKYEEVYTNKVIPHIPIIIRLDGKAFHNFTRHCVKPFDAGLTHAFQIATTDLNKKIGHFNLAYGQSDEVSILIYNPDTKTNEHLGGKYFKFCSIIASIFTLSFNRACYCATIDNPAYFDCRVFQLPVSEVANYFIWRQKDATRNSIQMLGQYHFSHKQLQNKSCSEIQEMLFSQKGINWDGEEIVNKRGWCFHNELIASFIDVGIPIFTQDRNFIESKLIRRED